MEKVAERVARLFATAVLAAAFAQAQPAQVKPEPGVFHHFHLNSIDPAGNMEYFSKNYGSIKVILQGFGVGVRMANAYALFERVDEEVPARHWDKDGRGVPAWSCHDPERCFEDARARFEMYPPNTGGLVARLQVLSNDPVASSKWFQDHLGVNPAEGKTPILFVQYSGSHSQPLENGKVFDHVAFSYPDLASAVKRLESEGVRVIERKPLSVIVAGPDGLRVEIAEDSDVGANAYWCPMDPKIRASKPGKCPICGMRLVPLDPGEYVAYPLEMKTTPHPVRAGRPAKFTFTIENPHTEAPVVNYETVHEKEFHLFIVSHDFSFFEHIHPVMQKGGSWTIDTTLPKPGAYQAFADFFPTGGTPQIVQKAFVTAGYTGSFMDARAKLLPDATLVKTESGTRVRLDSTGFISGLKQTLTFTLTDEKTGAIVKDLEPYLAAGAHMLILSEDLGDYVHGHALLDANTPGVLTIETVFPRESNYRIWIQFQRSGRVITTHFTVAVKRLR